MSPTKPLLLTATVFLSACISLPDVEEPQDPPDPGKPPELTLTLAAPTGTTYTNGTVSVQLQLQGDAPEQVELLVDDQPLTTLQAPYTFNWNTTIVGEGTHRLAARARIADKTFTSEVREVVVDRTPPQVVSRTPTPGAQDVWVRQPIQATFSEPLQASTVTSASVKLTVGGTEVAITTALSTDGKTLTMSPATPPTAPSSPQLTLTAAVTDLAGNALSLASSTWEWSHPISLSLGNLSAVGGVNPGSTPAETPHLHLDSNGRPYVAWLEKLGEASSFYNVFVGHWTGSSWELVGNAVDPEPTRTALGPPYISQIIRTDSSGIPFVAWIHYDLNYSSIHVSRWSNSQWLPIGSPIDPGESSNLYAPVFISFRLDQGNNPVVSWVRQEADSLVYVNAAKWSGQSWSRLGAPLRIYGIQNLANTKTSLVVDRSGAAVIAWPNHGSDGSTPEPHGILVRRWNGSQWEALGQTITARSQGYNHSPKAPQLMLDASGRLLLAWSESDGSTYNIHVRRWNENFSEWEPMGTLLSAYPGPSPASNPELSMDGVGNVFITWEELDGTSYWQHIRRWNDVTWEVLGAPIPRTSLAYPSFSVDADGNSYLAWSSHDILVHRYNN